MGTWYYISTTSDIEVWRVIVCIICDIILAILIYFMIDEINTQGKEIEERRNRKIQKENQAQRRVFIETVKNDEPIQKVQPPQTMTVEYLPPFPEWAIQEQKQDDEPKKNPYVQCSVLYQWWESEHENKI